MTAINFKKEFVPLILSGEKRQTMRGRAIIVGQMVQLYTGQRTKFCRLIGRSIVTDLTPTIVHVQDAMIENRRTGQRWALDRDLHDFAVKDGFSGWPAMRRFWERSHKNIDPWEGFLIRWGDLL